MGGPRKLMAFGDVIRVTKASLASGEASVTFVAPVAGNLIVFSMGRSTPHSAGGAWGGPAGWTALPDSGIDVGNVAGAAYFKISDGTETTVATAGTNTQGNTQCMVIEYEGPFAASPLDVTAENVANLSTVVTSQSTGTTGTTAQADELAITIVAFDATGTVTDVRAYTNSFTEAGFNDASSARAGSLQAKKVLSATGTVECTFSCTDTGDEMYGAIATFKKDVGGGGGSVVPVLMRQYRQRRN